MAVWGILAALNRANGSFSTLHSPYSFLICFDGGGGIASSSEELEEAEMGMIIVIHRLSYKLNSKSLTSKVLRRIVNGDS